MSDGPGKEEKRFVVKDRRRFTSEGELKTDAPADAPRHDPPPSAPAPRQEPAKGKGKSHADPRGAAGGPPAMDFMNFVASLATNAMAALGLLPPEQARGLPQNPELGREYIEILSMLQEKTRGNLTPQEESTLQRILTELRLAYVEVTRR